MEGPEPLRSRGHGSLCLFPCAASQQGGRGQRVQVNASYLISIIHDVAGNLTTFVSYQPYLCFLAFLSLFSLDAGHQQMISMWQTLHIDMKSLLSWQYFMKDFTQIRSWNINMVSLIISLHSPLISVFTRINLANFVTYAKLILTAT